MHVVHACAILCLECAAYRVDQPADMISIIIHCTPPCNALQLARDLVYTRVLLDFATESHYCANYQHNEILHLQWRLTVRGNATTAVYQHSCRTVLRLNVYYATRYRFLAGFLGWFLHH